jgi:molybdopterin-guanine dinucleotide biosynthesis protein B
MRIIGLAGWSGSGKTTLLTKVIPCLTARGKRVSTLKHAHHNFDVDRPGKDSFEHRSAGATEVLVVSGNRWALMHELRGAPEPALFVLLAKLTEGDLVLIEGFKRESFPKLEIHRTANGKPLLQPDDPWIVAVACDTALPNLTVPVVDLNDSERIADLLLAQAMPIERVKEHADAV